MAEFTDPALVVRFEGLGRETRAFKSYRLESSYLTSTDGFDVTIKEEDRELTRRLELQPVEILVDGHSQVLGRVDITEKGGGRGTEVSIRGRDYFADMVECHVDPTLAIKKEMDLATAITMAAGVVGISGVISDDDLAMRNIRSGKSIVKSGRARRKAAKPQEEYKPSPNEGIYAFLNRIVARHGATMQPANDRGTVVLTSPQYQQETAGRIVRLIQQAPGAENIVLEGSAVRDFSSFPTYVLAAGKSALVGTNRTPTSSKIVVKGKSVDVESEVRILKKTERNASTSSLANEIGGELADILDGAVAPGRRLPKDPPAAPGTLYRLLHIRDDDSRNQDQLDAVALRAFAQRFKDTLIYTCRLLGHADPVSGALWAVDTIVHVVDEVCDLNEPMWVASRTFEYAEGSGATTRLECWRLGAFQIDPEA